MCKTLLQRCCEIEEAIEKLKHKRAHTTLKTFTSAAFHWEMDQLLDRLDVVMKEIFT